jgi:hypothetical protein
VFTDLFNYWKKIFAVAFGMGVVSGIVMSYQFGTNWSVFSDKVGPVIGPLMGYEVLTAFFLEAGFEGGERENRLRLLNDLQFIRQNVPADFLDRIPDGHPDRVTGLGGKSFLQSFQASAIAKTADHGCGTELLIDLSDIEQFHRPGDGCRIFVLNQPASRPITERLQLVAQQDPKFLGKELRTMFDHGGPKSFQHGIDLALW